jgi:hypothetical protein
LSGLISPPGGERRASAPKPVLRLGRLVHLRGASLGTRTELEHKLILFWEWDGLGNNGESSPINSVISSQQAPQRWPPSTL